MSADRMLRVFSCVVLVAATNGYAAGGRDAVQREKSASSAIGEVSYEPLAAWLAESGMLSRSVAEVPRSDAAYGPDPCVPSANGCGPSDILGFFANCPLGLVCFEGACNVHDICYDTCGLPQLDCDFLFLILLLRQCEVNFKTGTSDAELCNNLAFMYYILVRVFGEGFYDDAQARVCQCSPNPVFAPPGGDRGLVMAPPFVDADADLMPDDWELAVGLDPTRIDSFDDTDGDGLVNIAEYINAMDPLVADSDGDGVLDGMQVFSVQSGCCATP